MSRLFFQSLCHAFSYVAALMILQLAGKKHSIVLKPYPFIQKSPFKYFIMLLLKSVVFSIIIRIHKFA